MTDDDEAFVRVVVDHPGDDTPRLVYADWLDDRDDPRGEYLRAERAWANLRRGGLRPADSPEVRRAAVGLDETWVSRVSRPPHGVCLDHVPFDTSEGSAPSLRPDDIAAFERKYDISLPVEYRAFLLNRNGGEFGSVACEIDVPAARDPSDGQDWDTHHEVGGFLVLPPEGGLREADPPDWEEVYFGPYLDREVLKVADDGVGDSGGYYLGLAGPRRGQIFYYQKHYTIFYPPVAASLAEFLAALKPKTRRPRE